MLTEDTHDGAPRVAPFSGTEMLLAAFDQIDYGVMVVDDSRRLHLANAAARAILDGHMPFRLAGDRLVTGESAWDALLERLLRSALRGERRIETFESGRRSIGIAAIPLSGTGDTPLLMLTFGRQAACETITLRVFARTTRLTQAETAVLEKLASGLSPAMIAETNRIKPSTVRTHIRNLLSKTGASGLRELTARLATLPPVRPAMSAGA